MPSLLSCPLHATEKKNPGTIECVICSAVKHYSHKQRRFGVFACEMCAKFFSNFMRNRKAYYCNHTGSLPFCHVHWRPLTATHFR